MTNYRKDFDIVKILLISITIMMIISTINIFFVNGETYIAKAQEKKTNELIEKDDTIEKNFFVHVINKSMSILEINYKENYDSSSKNIIKEIVDRTFDFEYKNPKTFLKSQIPILNQIEKEIVQTDNDHELLGPDNDTRIFNPIEFNNGEEFTDTNDSNLDDKDSEASNLEEVINSEDNHNNSTENEENTDENQIEDSNNEIEIVSNLPPAPEKIVHNSNEPLIFIYHTHGTESYKPESVGNYHSLNRQFTVLKVGEELYKHLENRGYKIIHDETIHDYPSYAGSYGRSLETLNKNLENHSSLKILLDVHRDAIDHVDNLEKSQYDLVRKNSYIQINGENVARFSLVVGTANENANELKKFAYYIKAVSDELYPGLAYKIYLKNYKYNQYKSDYSTLLEIGNNTNTIDEAMRTAKYLGEILDVAFRRFIESQ